MKIACERLLVSFILVEAVALKDKKAYNEHYNWVATRGLSLYIQTTKDPTSEVECILKHIIVA